MKPPRVYGAWAGNEAGVREDKSRCIEEVWPGSGGGWVPYQCLRKRGHGPNGEYCKQHGRKAQELEDRKRHDTAEPA